MNEVTRAAAVEAPKGRVQVLSSAAGRARRFEIAIGGWVVEGADREIAIAQRVELELRQRGVKSEIVSVRVQRE